jgi:hypothetical protein
MCSLRSLAGRDAVERCVPEYPTVDAELGAVPFGDVASNVL